MRLLDLFSGIGGFSLAFDRAGFETVAFSEIEPFPCRVLAHHWPNIPNLGDIRAIDGEALRGQIDVVTFGSPCQDLSVAGRRAGFTGERSSLFHEAIRVTAGARPAFAIWENVPGAYSSNGGWDFAAVLDAMADIGALDIAWTTLDAQYFGVPQRRRRIFLIADFRAERAGEILFEPEGVSGNLEKSGETGEEVTRSSGKGSTLSLRNGARDADTRAGRSGIGLEREVSFALQSKQQHAVIQEVAGTLGGGSGHRGWAPATDRMTFVPEVAPALRSNFYSDHDGDENRLIPEVAGGLTTRYGKGVNTTADDGAVIPVQDAAMPRDKKQNRIGVGQVHDPMYTLDSHGAHAVGFYANSGYKEDPVSGADAPLKGGKENAGQAAVAFAENQRAEVRESDGMAVRRLTPKECERLQGFPDDWTNIPGASDSARYRALGNSVAVPVVSWIAKRMADVLKSESSGNAA